MQAAESGGGADAGGDGDAAELEERISAALVSMCMGYQLVQRNAPRIIWSLIAAAVFPRDNFLEVCPPPALVSSAERPVLDRTAPA